MNISSKKSDYNEKDLNNKKHPRIKKSYENDDADGNRGEWIKFIFCPNSNCHYEFSEEDIDNEIDHCPDCNQLIDWGPTEY